MKNWYSIKAMLATDGSPAGAEVTIFDEIGVYGVSARFFLADIKQYAGQPLAVLINSPGGSMFDALAMYNALRDHSAAGGKVTTRVLGIAASAASIVAMAGDVRIMADNAFLMIHAPLTSPEAVNAADMREIADLLDKFEVSLVRTYANRTGLPEDEIKALIADATWLSADEAVAKGFADEVQTSLRIAAAFDLDRLPENVRNALTTEPPVADPDPEADPKPDPEPVIVPEPEVLPDTLAQQITNVAVTAGLGDLVGVWLLDSGVKSLDQARALIAEAREINAICVAAKLPDQAAVLIRAKAPLDEARKTLFNILADADALTHVSGVIPSNNSKPLTPAQPAAIKSADIWAARRNIKEHQ